MKFFNSDSKKDKRKAYESILLLFLTIALFVTSTYAWFTDTAYSSGNRVFSGNMAVEIIATEDELADYLIKNYPDGLLELFNSRVDEPEQIDNIEDLISNKKALKAATYLFATDKTVGLGLESYTRVYNDDNLDEVREVYYIISDTNTSVINLYNIEPGQARYVNIKYLNKGDLAFEAAGSLRIDLDESNNPKSYTGLETLNRQFSGDTYVYYNDYSVNSKLYSYDDDLNTIDPMMVMLGVDYEGNNVSYNHTTKGFADGNIYGGYEDYSRRFDKLIESQALASNESTEEQIEGKNTVKKYLSDVDVNTTEYKTYPYQPLDYDAGGTVSYYDDGGHLEDVLEVFVGIDAYATHDVFELRDPKYYMGTFKQFQFLIENGPSASSDYDYSAYTDGTSYDGSYLLMNNSVPVVYNDSITIEEKYMYMHESAKSNLHYDYQKYLASAGGYTIPKDAITDKIENRSVLNGVEMECTNLTNEYAKVRIYQDRSAYNDDEINKDYEIVEAREIGSTNLCLYMPTDVSNKYQNASLSLSFGVTATQVEYEMDSSYSMNYDKQVVNVQDVHKVNPFILFPNYEANDTMYGYLENDFSEQNSLGYDYTINDYSFTTYYGNDYNYSEVENWLYYYNDDDDYGGRLVKAFEDWDVNAIAIQNTNNTFTGAFDESLDNYLYDSNYEDKLPVIRFGLLPSNDYYQSYKEYDSYYSQFDMENNYYIGYSYESYYKRVYDFINQYADTTETDVFKKSTNVYLVGESYSLLDNIRDMFKQLQEDMLIVGQVNDPIVINDPSKPEKEVDQIFEEITKASVENNFIIISFSPNFSNRFSSKIQEPGNESINSKITSLFTCILETPNEAIIKNLIRNSSTYDYYVCMDEKLLSEAVVTAFNNISLNNPSKGFKHVIDFGSEGLKLVNKQIKEPRY